MAGKVEIPEQLKNELPQNKWGKVLGVTPIVMTVIATMLAGLASSEMTKAQYDRALAAQLQSKAGDQWSYFQAKKLRGALNRNAFELMEDSADVLSLEADLLEQKVDHATFVALFGGQAPTPMVSKLDDEVRTALKAVADSKPENEVAAALAKVSAAKLAEALKDAKQDAVNYDNVIKPVNEAINLSLKPIFKTFRKEKLRAFNAAGFRYQADRYDVESKLNATIANLLELQVRQNNYSAEKHHARSGKFFYGMLASQMAVILSTFAIAARRRSFLWSVAAAAGTAAVGFSLYVYLYV